MSPEFPERSLDYPSQLARAGDTLYAIDAAHGLFVFDVQDPSAPLEVRTISLPGAPLWIGVSDARLTLIVKGLSEDPDLVERESVTHLVSYSIENPEEPVWMGSVSLAGELRLARQKDARLVTLSAVFDTPQCQPERGYVDSWQAPREMVVTELQPTDDGLAVSDQLAVTGDGFVETGNAFVITQGEVGDAEGTLTVVALGDGSSGFVRYGPVDAGAMLLASAPMAFADSTLAFFATEANELWLHVVELSENGVLQRRSLALASNGGGTRSLGGSAFAARFALIADPALAGSGLLVDLFAEGGPAVVGNLPEGVQAVVSVGSRWLGINPESSLAVAFSLSESGEVSVTSEATFAWQISGQGGPPAVAWDEAHERVLVPHSQSSVSSTDYYLGELRLTGGALVWTEGPQLTGSAVLPDFAGGPYRLAIEPGDDVTFAVTQFGGDPIAETRRILEAVDLTATTSTAVSLADHIPAVALTDTFQARLFADLDGTRKIAFRALDQGEDTQVLELGHRADSLHALGTTVLAYSLRYSAGCGPGELPPLPELQCTPDEQPAISVFALEGGPERASVIPLPEVTVPELADARVTWEWQELVVQGDQVGLLLSRDTFCDSATACEELGIQTTVELGIAGAASTEENPPGEAGAPAAARVEGRRDEVWLYPLNLAQARFEQPKQLGEVDPYGYFTAEGFVDQEGFSLLGVRHLEESPDGPPFDSAQLELLVFDQVTDATPVERATLRGQPLAVHGSTVITVEPASALGEGTVSAGVDVHRLRVQDNRATIEQTLDIGTGYEGHAWGDKRGYVLLTPDDRCVEPRSSEVVSLRLQDGTLTEAARVSVPGTRWEVSRASDEVLLLKRSIDGLEQYAIYDVSDTGLALRRIVTVPSAYLTSYPYRRPVVVSGSQVLIGAELVGGRDV